MLATYKQSWVKLDTFELESKLKSSGVGLELKLKPFQNFAKGLKLKLKLTAVELELKLKSSN